MKGQYQRQQYPLYSPPPQQQPPFRRHVYKGRTLIILAGGYIISWILLFADPATWSAANEANSNAAPGIPGMLSIMGLLCVVIAILIIDWHGLTTLNGWIKWSKMKTWQKLVLGYFFISGLSIFLVAPYLVQAYNTYREDKRQKPLLLRQKIAQQESELGLMPEAEGECRVCHKHLQADAEFCVYCGAPAISRPHVCPNCATVTFPDAQWCPQCRTPLKNVLF
ncbi:MAG: zinc ribbon domain-containing protein [Ktedonobacteraceae bacterium]